MASPDSSQVQVLASTTGRAAACLACLYRSAASWVLQGKLAPYDSFFTRCLTASLTFGVHHWVQKVLLRQASETSGQQLHAPLLRVDVQNKVYLHSMSPTSPRMWEKLSQDCTDRGFSQTFPIDLHYTSRSAKFLWLFSLQTDLTHHH